MVVIFSFTTVFPPGMSIAQVMPNSILNLPSIGSMVSLSSPFTPTIVKGLTIYPDNPLQFDFIVDKGDDNLEGENLRSESKKLIKYFLASLTVPEENQWVNLSPYEKDRIVPQEFGETDMGRDLLAQDYLLKQLTASLIYPENDLGKNFWKKIYAKMDKEYGITDVPINTFNKVWIVPDKAVVYEQGESVFIVENHLKVMLEEDYAALRNENVGDVHELPLHDESKNISTEIIRELIIPAIEIEINQGKNFSDLRQIYNSMLLATWYKRNLSESLLGKLYVDQNKIKGIDIEDKNAKQAIYNQYLEAFKKGVYDYIREEYDSSLGETIPRKYFSGGTEGYANVKIQNQWGKPAYQIYDQDHLKITWKSAEGVKEAKFLQEAANDEFYKSQQAVAASPIKRNTSNKYDAKKLAKDKRSPLKIVLDQDVHVIPNQTKKTIKELIKENGYKEVEEVLAEILASMTPVKNTFK